MSAGVLVTGGTGLIGRYVVARLLAAGRPVRVLARDPRRLDAEVIGRARVMAGDLTDPAAVARAANGVTTVLHLAACARAWARDPGEFAAVNVDAVGRLLEAARLAGVERLVHVSTVLTLPGLWPRGGARALTPYEETKLAGERLVERYAASGMHAVIVHPTRVFGPGPLNDANGVTRLLAHYLRGPVVARLDDGDVLANYVHADDVAAGILLAAERGHRGAHYILGGENASLRHLLELAATASGARRRVVAVPRTAALAAAHAAALWGRLGGDAPITPAWVRCYFEDQRVDLTQTRREIGYQFRPLRTGVEETIQWLRTRLPAAS
jgi:nucleoside-diphosphate-sugar epimerase